MYPDGGGLYLQVTASGAKSWIFRYTLDGRTREMGLGSAQVIDLKGARDRAGECRRLKHDGRDPIEHRNRQRQDRRLEEARGLTFTQAQELFIAAHEAGWRNAKHRAQWRLAVRAPSFVRAFPKC